MRVRKPKGERKKTCSKCNENLEPQRIDKYRYCLKCHRAHAAAKRIKKQREKYGIKATCSKCGNPLNENLGKERYCKECKKEYARLHRLKYSELSPEQKKKANARSYVKEYVKRGKIKKKPCEKCGNEDSQMHHEDYNKPLEIKWLCRPCHLLLHKTLVRLKLG